MLTCMFYLAVLIYGAESVLLKPMEQLNMSQMSVNTGSYTTNSKNLIADLVANPKQFVAIVAKLDPVEVANIITLLEDLMTTSQTREDYLIDTLTQKVAEAQITENALAVAQLALTNAEGQLTDAQNNVEAKAQEFESAQSAHDAKTTEKNAAETEHDAEIGSLNDEQQVLVEVIDMLGGLVPIQVPEVPTGWAVYSNDEACENNGAGRDQNCDGDLECCKSSVLAKGLHYVVWWTDHCFGSSTCNSGYSLPGTVNYRHTD